MNLFSVHEMPVENRTQKLFRLYLIVLFLCSHAFAFDGGDGTATNPYQISTPEQLISIGSNVLLLDKYYILKDEIDLSAYSFTTAVIAPDTDCTNVDFDETPFTGGFDGNDFKIKNLTIDTVSDSDASNNYNDYLGLFGKIGSAGQVINLGLENVNISVFEDTYYLGGLCGCSSHAVITNCSVTATVTSNAYSENFGLLCGSNDNGVIMYCYSDGSITSGDYSTSFGGLCGINDNGTIAHCFSNCTMDTGYFLNSLGGLCGKNNSGTINDCFSTARITTEQQSSQIGGLCGVNSGGTITHCYTAKGLIESGDFCSSVGSLCGVNTNSGTINDCFSTMNITSMYDVTGMGGLCGTNTNSEITNCYSDNSVQGDDHVGGICGYNQNATIAECYSMGIVVGQNGSTGHGGLCGYNDQGTIRDCYSTCRIMGGFGSGSHGGLCGLNSGSITTSYSTGNIYGQQNSAYIGGLCGDNDNGSITHCYSTGSVTSGQDSFFLGGLCGRNTDGTFTECFWDTDTSGQATSAGGTGKTTIEMMTLSTFTDAGWDFDPDDGDPADWILVRPGEDYARLIWQEIIDGDIAGLWGVDLTDLSALMLEWGSLTPEIGDIAPPGGDGKVDFLDFALFAKNWLNGL